MPLGAALLELLSGLSKALIPGSTAFLLVGLTIGVVLLLRGGRRRVTGRAWLTGLTVFYWVLSLPIVAEGLEAALGAGQRPLESAAQAAGSRHLVVLTGGGATLRGAGGSFDVMSHASIYRMLEAERLYHVLEAPTLIVSGGPAGVGADGNPESEAMKAQLVARGIPEERIWVEAQSPDTHEQAIRVAARLDQEGIESFVLVTSGSHMRRALGAFADQGLTPIPSAAPDGPKTEGLARLLPSAMALGRSEQAIREVLALAYYALRGWLG